MADRIIIDRFSQGEASPTIRILAIESDPVMLSGLVTCLNRFPDLQVAAAAESVVSAWQILTNSVVEVGSLDLILFGLPLHHPLKERFSKGEASPTSLEFCHQVKTSYPNLPILLLISPQDRDLNTAFELGIEGCCVRGSSILDLVAGIRSVAGGQTNWAPEVLARVKIGIESNSGNLIDRLKSASLEQIDRTLAQLDTNLHAIDGIASSEERVSRLDRIIIAGRKRELNTARWLVNKILPGTNVNFPQLDSQSANSQLIIPSLSDSSHLNIQSQNIFETIAAKLQSSLNNLTPLPLEIDILRREKKQELCYLILQQFEGLLAELRFSQVTIDQLLAKQDTILPDLWRSIATDFFGRYHTASIDNNHTEIIPTILQDAPIIQAEILAKIPQSIELLNYLLFNTPLIVDSISTDLGSRIAEDRACMLLENLTIQMANAVMQPLLNRFGNLESMKTGFYDRRLLSSREIERFRNNLSWRYRIDRYIGEPQAIFESQHRLFIFTNYGIDRIAIYAPRPQELSQLAGIPLIVTLALETRDALSPRLKSASTFMGSSIVYLLTEIIGRGIGLIGRGIIKGIGNIWYEKNRKP